MTTIPKARLSSEAAHDQRTALVKDMLAKENAATDAKTAKLRALRLAREAEAGTNATTPAKPAKKSKAR